MLTFEAETYLLEIKMAFLFGIICFIKAVKTYIYLQHCFSCLSLVSLQITRPITQQVAHLPNGDHANDNISQKKEPHLSTDSDVKKNNWIIWIGSSCRHDFVNLVTVSLLKRYSRQGYIIGHIATASSSKGSLLISFNYFIFRLICV